jgi:lipopolysaccharide biosynthesis glycosyltransferase
MRIIICCNKNDFFLTRICVASIRYYYPDVDIFLVKDFLNGPFSSTELERAMNVKILDLGPRKFGWSAAKMYLLLGNQFPGEKLLSLDSDIIFAGRFLEKISQDAKGFDFVVNKEPNDDPYSEFVTKHYYDFKYLNKIDPAFQFPGYFFNGGQMIITTGKLKQSEVIDYFELDSFPYWKQLDKMPFVDQSLLNYMLPKKEQNGEMKILKTKFMLWSESMEVKELDIDQVKKGEKYLYLIHWAGALRIPYINKMTRADLLVFFEDFYYSNVPLGNLKKIKRKTLAASDYFLRLFYRNTIKKIIRRK